MGSLTTKEIRHFAHHWGWALFLVVSLLPLLWTGIHQEIMEVDSAQYASMSREMLDGAPLTELTEHGQRYQSRGYPDKPPLIFWTGALGMWLLGPTEAGFRLFSWLAAALSIWAIGNWARLLWGQAAVWPSRWVYACNLGMLLMNVDLRTDSLLLGLTTLALWQGQAFLFHRGTGSLVGFTLSLSMALMAKGPIAAVAVVVGLLPSWPMVERSRKSQAHPLATTPLHTTRVIPALLLIILGVFLLLSPMLWGLYKQWGWHDGVRYYLWTQSFGRITGENPWANQPDPLFLTGSLAWSFLPWTLILVASLVYAVKSWRIEKWHYAGLGALMGLIMLTVALSVSAYQLPHYIYIVWPFAAVLCGRMLSATRVNKYLWLGHNALLILLLLAGAGLIALVAIRPVASIAIGFAWLVISYLVIRGRFTGNHALVAHTVAMFILLSAALLLVFYPNVLPYQAGVRAAQWYRSQSDDDPIWILGCGDESLHAMHFYARRIVPVATKPTELPPTAAWVYTDSEGKAHLSQSGRTADTLQVLPFTRVTTLKPDFFHPQKREKILENRYLIHIQPIFAPAHP